MSNSRWDDIRFEMGCAAWCDPIEHARLTEQLGGSRACLGQTLTEQLGEAGLSDLDRLVEGYWRESDDPLQRDLETGRPRPVFEMVADYQLPLTPEQVRGLLSCVEWCLAGDATGRLTALGALLTRALVELEE